MISESNQGICNILQCKVKVELLCFSKYQCKVKVELLCFSKYHFDWMANLVESDTVNNTKHQWSCDILFSSNILYNEKKLP